MLRLVQTLRLLPRLTRRKGQGHKAKPADEIQDLTSSRPDLWAAGIHQLTAGARDGMLADFHVSVRDGMHADFQIAIVEIQQTRPMIIIMMILFPKMIAESPLQLLQPTQASPLQMPMINYCHH